MQVRSILYPNLRPTDKDRYVMANQIAIEEPTEAQYSHSLSRTGLSWETELDQGSSLIISTDTRIDIRDGRLNHTSYRSLDVTLFVRSHHTWC